MFSFRSPGEDIQVSPVTIKNWMSVFERLYIVFPIMPYSKKIARAIQRQPKYYFYDWSQIPEAGSRFENIIASHLYKAVQLWTDLGKASLTLHYLRDRDRREVDFLVAREGHPWFLVEAKLSETRVSDALELYAKKLGIPAIQIVQTLGYAKQSGSVFVVSAERWLGMFP